MDDDSTKVSGPPWSVWLHQTVRRWDGEATFCKHIFLPFPPFKGLSICFDETNADYASVHLVEWVPTDNVFWVWCREFDIEDERHPSDRFEPIAAAKQYFIDNGWELHHETLLDVEDLKELDKQKKGWRKFRREIMRATGIKVNPRKPGSEEP